MSIQNPYDHALKILARTYPEQFLQLGIPGQPIRLLGTLSNVELALEIDRVDFLHEIELSGERAYFHIDFQLEHDEDCRRRFFVYNGMLTELKKPNPVITLPVYLRPREKALPDTYEVKVGGILFHRFSYTPLKLWQYLEQIRSGELYIFAPLLPVLTQPMSETLLIEERRLILTHETDAARQNTLLTTAILIAAQSKLFNTEFLWELFKEDTMDFENPVIVRLFDRYYGQRLAEEKQKLAEEKQKLTEETQKLEQKLSRDLALATQRIVEATRREAEAAHREAEAEAARREAEAEAARREAEAEVARQWQDLMLKVLEHRFPMIPVALVLLLQTVLPAERTQVTDLILAAPDVEHCLSTLRQLRTERTTTSLVDKSHRP